MYNTLGFTDKATRDEEYAKIKATGARGCVKYTTHDQNHPQIIYVLAYPVVSNQPQSSTSPEVPLTDAAASDMIAEGGNADENSISTSKPSPEAGASIPAADISSAS